MNITALAPWFGSKREMAPEIVRQLGPHRAYWEPFCGSMAVLLAKPRCAYEVVNDLHGDLINLALVIRHPTLGPRLYRELRRTLVHEEVKRISKAQVNEQRWVANYLHPERLDDKDLKRAYWYFVNAWLGRNGSAGTTPGNDSFCVRWNTNGGTQGTRFAQAIASIPGWRRRIERVTILARDGLEVIEKIQDEPDAAMYVDPPYLVKTTGYQHDFVDADHVHLAELLQRFRQTRVVVSYYAHPRLAELYPGWTMLDRSRTKHMALSGRRGSEKKTAPEVLLINGPAVGEERTLF